MHVDIVGHLGVEVQVILGHVDIHAGLDSRHFTEMAELLRSIAVDVDLIAQQYAEAEGQSSGDLRVFETPLGDRYYEVEPNVFVEADTRGEAEYQVEHQAFTFGYEQIRKLYPNLTVVHET